VRTVLLLKGIKLVSTRRGTQGERDQGRLRKIVQINEGPRRPGHFVVSCREKGTFMPPLRNRRTDSTPTQGRDHPNTKWGKSDPPGRSHRVGRVIGWP